MGQTQGSYSNPLLQDWHQHPNQHNLFVNLKTQQQAESHLVLITKNEQAILRKRMQESHNFILKILYFEPVQKNKLIRDQAKYIVYTEKLYPITPEMWVPTTSALSILKGFRRLSSNHGMMRINYNMIKVNNKKQIRVWMNENIFKHEPAEYAQSQQQMLADIVEIIMQFDTHTSGLMMKCFTINEAINSILRDIAESNKNQLNFSNRTSKNQDKARGSHNSQKQVPFQPKNNFRSTKQTEDDSLRPFNENSLKFSTKKQVGKTIQIEPAAKNFLHNVTVPKSPTYINIDQFQHESKNSMGLKNSLNDSNNHNFSHQNNTQQKQSSIQFNSSHPTKMVSSGRPYKPIEHKNQNYSEFSNMSSAGSSNLVSSNHQKIYRQTQKFAQVGKPPFFMPQRKSNLNKNYIERMEMGQESDVGVNQKTKGSLQFNERSEINTSRQFIETHSFTRNRFQPMNEPINNVYIQSNRTKTQQFYSTNQQHHIGYSPRLRTNYLQSTSQIHTGAQPQMTKQAPLNYMNTTKVQTPNISQRKQVQFSHQSPKHDLQRTKDYNQQNSSLQQDKKKQMKLKQAQKIKEQMGCLGIMNNTTKTLTNQKSARDLLIKQKIQQKNKKHEELKCAITRLLSQ